MKRKLLSLLLVITLLAVTVSTGLPSILAANENLITNGDFSDYTSSSITGWGITLNSKSNAKGKVEKDVKITDDLTANAVKFTTGAAAGTNYFYHKNKIKIEKNTSYTMTYWVKMRNIKGASTYLYEPDYISKDGTQKTDEWTPSDGVNVYTYAHDNGSTRVCRTDIQHKWYVAETGHEIGDANGVSMFITRSGSTNKVLTPDFPETTREGEWLQVVHTFTTGNLAAHEAVATYCVKFPGTVDGEIWLADFKMYAEKVQVAENYTPSVNDDTLGFVSKDVALVNGQPSEITAKPFGENIFEGWFVDGECVSTDTTFAFTYDPNNKPKYEARFKKADFGVDGDYEDYSANELLTKATYNTVAEWSDTAFIDSSKDGLHFIDSNNTGTWREAKVTTEKAHTGSKSLVFSGQYGGIGRKFSNLQKNTDYVVSVYAHTVSPESTSDVNNKGVSTRIITTANASFIKSTGSSLTGKNTGENGIILKHWEPVNLTEGWQEISVKFNSGNNTEVIFWLESSGYNAKLYLDNYSIARPPQPFKPNNSNPELGIATSETTSVFVGAEVTVNAESVNDGKFLGWFIGDELVSSELNYTFTYSDEFKDLTAKFEKGPNTLEDYSFENRYTNDQVLAQSTDIQYESNTSLWNENLYKETSKDGENRFFIDSDWAKYGKAVATKTEAHTGDFSIKYSPNSRSIGYKLTGLNKNTKYTISFYAKTKGTTDGKTETVGSIAVTDANMSCIMKTADGKLVQRTTDTGALGKTTGGDARETWKKFSVRFDSADSTDVIVWIRPEGANTVLYIDDLTLSFTPKEFKPTSNNSGLGSVTPTDFVECSEGQSVTVTATPFPDVNFIGWFVGDELMSEDATFTFNYEDKYQGLTAVFEGAPGTIPNAGLEYYQNGQILASYNNNNDPKFNNNPPWHIDTTYRTDTVINVSVTNQIVHSGEKAVVTNTPYRYTGLDIEGLNPNTEYIVSFWAYITGSEPVKDTDDKNPKNVTSAFILPKGKQVVSYNETTGKYSSVNSNLGLGAIPAQVDCYNQWKKIEFLFTTTEEVTDVTLWVNFSGFSAKLYMDDFAIFQGVKANYSADLGGEVSANFDSEYVALGSDVTVYATPFEGNTFTGWYDIAGKLLSDQVAYTFTVNEEFAVIAKFDGYNKPATDLFAINGNDGTFENGTVTGWKFSDPQYGCEWCSAAVSSKLVYEGNNSLEINGRYRNSILPLTGLTPYADYRISFYINQPDTNEKAKIDSIGVVGELDNNLNTAGTIFASANPILANVGWNRIDLYFNSGANIAANLIIRFSAETLDSLHDRLFIDNLSLYRYEAEENIVNGSFDQDKYNWIGNGSVVTEGGNKVLSLGANESVYQDLAVAPYSSYKATFKVKGELTAAVQNFAAFNLDPKDYIASVSYVKANGATWTEYTLNFYSGVNRAVNFVFKAAEDGAMIDDLKVTKLVENAGAVIEQIDFESLERFALTNTDSQFSIYTATSQNDPNVYSGKNSLKFTYNELLEGTSSIFDEAWLSYQPMPNGSIKVSMKYKIVKGNEGGTINLAPEYSGTYGGDSGFEHVSKTDAWQTVSFYFTNTAYSVLKLKIASMMGSTEGDFYIDDIVISVTPPMVLEENSKVTYCERLYNAIDNEGFENPVTNKDWANLPASAKVIKGDALKGSHFLRANGGTKYILPIAVEPGKEYYFAASVRGTAKTSGAIGIAADPKGVSYFMNRDDQVASVVQFDKNEKSWKRKGFKFTTDSEYVYLTIDVDAGAMDIDSVMMFTSDYGYRYDPNDYTVYVPYDYDNLKSATTVINGGFGDQPYYKGDANTQEDSSASPSTGDSIALPVLTIVLAVVASAVLMLIRKRKEGAENA